MRAGLSRPGRHYAPLHNFAMPLIRYAIGDLAEVGAACPCGRTLPVLRRVLGRTRDMLVLPSGEKRCSTASARRRNCSDSGC